MNDSSSKIRGNITKNEGSTLAEEYLRQLCERSFLSLWSYSGVYRNQGGSKEICDLLVVFGDDVIIFSDKNCKFQEEGDVFINWKNWYQKAIYESAKQAWAAERWLKNFPDRVFLDNRCTEKFPFKLPDPQKARYHLVVVAHSISSHNKKHWGGSGSFVLRTADVDVSEELEMPFIVGDLDPNKTFVHILDDNTLDVVMGTLDTISDFTAYLSKKEKLLRSGTSFFVAGEEELLAIYLKNVNENDEHDFIFPDNALEKADMIHLDEGFWEGFQNSPQRLAQKKADEISYVWDDIIESFNKNTIAGTGYQLPFSRPKNIEDSEKVARFMARPPRFIRRTLSESLKELLQNTTSQQRMLRVIPPWKEGEPYYLILLFPLPADMDYEEYRLARSKFLEACGLVVRHKFPEAKDIVGFATESGAGLKGRSEDCMYLDGRIWNPEMDDTAKKLQKDLNILVNPVYVKSHSAEYPVVKSMLEKNPRNKPCPCGSGKKYKKCCG